MPIEYGKIITSDSPANNSITNAFILSELASNCESIDEDDFSEEQITALKILSNSLLREHVYSDSERLNIPHEDELDYDSATNLILISALRNQLEINNLQEKIIKYSKSSRASFCKC